MQVIQLGLVVAAVSGVAATRFPARRQKRNQGCTSESKLGFNYDRIPQEDVLCNLSGLIDC